MSFKVYVAPDRQSAEHIEEHGFSEVTDRDIQIDIYEFDTIEEARAFCKGIDYGAGWAQPYYEIKSS